MATKIKLKRGKLSGDECTYIERWKNKKTVEQIASHLRRPVNIIEKHLLTEVGEDGEINKAGLAGELENRPEWLQLKQQFDDEDLEFYKYRYMQLVSQFGKDDITVTEETQIFQLINFQIMGNQTMKERKPIVIQQKECQARLEDAYKRIKDCDEGSCEYKEYSKTIAELEGRYKEIANNLKQLNTRNESYTDKANELLKQLKATRDQRVKVIESGDKNFLSLLKQLALEDQRNKIGREIEQMRVATYKEQERLETPHLYDGGVMDQPLLTPESVVKRYPGYNDDDDVGHGSPADEDQQFESEA